MNPTTFPITSGEALKFAADVLELYDDATMKADYMLDSGDCAAILRALADAPYFATASAASAPVAQSERDAPAHGHREDFYLMANARTLAEQPIHAIRSMPNWILAKELFATGSTSAYQICRDAGINPDGYRVTRTLPAIAAQQPAEGGEA